VEDSKPATPGGDWHIDPQVVAERIGREVVVVHLRTNKIYELNPTAARVFELMRGGADRPALERALLAEYEVAPDRLAASLDRLLGELRAARLLL
jgi:hypothetical protein